MAAVVRSVELDILRFFDDPLPVAFPDPVQFLVIAVWPGAITSAGRHASWCR